ncbi:MAG: endonuclease III [Ginsengibacter sp.]
MTKRARYDYVINYFLTHSPDPSTELVYKNTYELLVSVMLSAQCTDKRVNQTTPAFFKHFPGLAELKDANIAEVYELIKSISYPNSKARHLVEMAKMSAEIFNGEIPMTVTELMMLPGVGRKTANVITSVIDQQPNMAVDTHVFRVAARIGLTTNAKTPWATEKQLIRHLPQHLVHKAHHWLILHGRYICMARNPKCNICGIRVVCKYFAIINNT